MNLTIRQIERLLAKISVAENGCWLWAGYIRPDGYGQYCPYKGSRNFVAHRVVYQILVGLIPEGKTLDHQCHNHDLTCSGGRSCLHRQCVNPDHIEPADVGVNVSRGLLRRRFCKHGHALLNIYQTGNTGRRCMPCVKRRMGEHRARNREKYRLLAQHYRDLAKQKREADVRIPA